MDRRTIAWEEREIDAAASQAAAIGGHAGDEDLDPAERPLAEAGEGEAEGFELAEKDLIEAAEIGEGWADPGWQAFTQEAEIDPGEFSEADHEDSSEVPRADR